MRRIFTNIVLVALVLLVTLSLGSCKKKAPQAKLVSFDPAIDAVAMMPIDKLDSAEAERILSGDTIADLENDDREIATPTKATAKSPITVGPATTTADETTTNYGNGKQGQESCEDLEDPNFG